MNRQSGLKGRLMVEAGQAALAQHAVVIYALGHRHGDTTTTRLWCRQYPDVWPSMRSAFNELIIGPIVGAPCARLNITARAWSHPRLTLNLQTDDIGRDTQSVHV